MEFRRNLYAKALEKNSGLKTKLDIKKYFLYSIKYILNKPMINFFNKICGGNKTFRIIIILFFIKRKKKKKEKKI
jgi:cellobiose-specific phosphotransferase system component IIC